MRLRKTWRLTSSSALATAAIMLFPIGAVAQAPTDSTTVEDVVVTSATNADNQATALQSKPVAATIITRDQIRAAQIDNLEQARKLVPSLVIKQTSPQNLTYNVRGIGNSDASDLSSIFNGVPIYVDGVYFARPGAWTTDVPDLVGIQVLKGPQSTKGGWDSTGGAVHISTAMPSFEPESKLAISYGTYNHVQLKGSLTGAIAGSDKAAFRLSIYGVDRDGYSSSTTTGKRYNDWHDKGVRAQLLLQPDNDLTARVIVDYSYANTANSLFLPNGAVTRYANGAAFPNNFFVRAAKVGYAPSSFDALSHYATDIAAQSFYERVDSYGGSADIRYNLNGYLLSSLTAFRQYGFNQNQTGNSQINVDTHRVLNPVTSAQSFQEELKISTPPGEAIEATAGLFYYREQFRLWYSLGYGSQAGVWFGNPTTVEQTLVDKTALDWLNRNSYANVQTNSIAAFSHATWHVTPNLDISAGLRYSYTAKSAAATGQVYGQSLDGLTANQQLQAATLRSNQLGPPYYYYSAATHEGLPSGLISVAYKFSPDVLGYATYSHGVRPGGPNIAFAAANLPVGAKPTVKAEELDNFEIGIKSEFFDQRLLANLAAFWIVDRNYITNVAELSSSGGTATRFLSNAKRAISRGIEADVRAQPIEGLNLYGSATFNDAYFDSFKSAPCPVEVSNLYVTCDFTGKRLSIVPRWSFSVGGEYKRPIGATLPLLDKPLLGFVGGDFNWQSTVYSETSDSIYSIIHPYGILNLHVGVQSNDEAWRLVGWIHNALDQKYYTNQQSALQVGAGLVSGTVGAPLMAGVTLAAKW